MSVATISSLLLKLGKIWFGTLLCNNESMLGSKPIVLLFLYSSGKYNVIYGERQELEVVLILLNGGSSRGNMQKYHQGTKEHK